MKKYYQAQLFEKKFYFSLILIGETAFDNLLNPTRLDQYYKNCCSPYQCVPPPWTRTLSTQEPPGCACAQISTRPKGYSYRGLANKKPIN